MGSNFPDEIEIDCCSFFKHIDDLIVFPPDYDSDVASDNCEDFTSFWANCSESLAGSDPIFPASNSSSNSEISAELAVPYEDIVQLEWLSTFLEESFSGGGMTLNKEILNVKNEASNSQFQPSSAVSVLENSGSSTCSEEKTNPTSQSNGGPQRARSKRPHPATFNHRSAMQIIDPTSSVTDKPNQFNGPMMSSEPENFMEFHEMMIPMPAAEHKKEKKLKIVFPSDATKKIHNSTEVSRNPPKVTAVRKCMHCQITKTPQWRAGPMGAKTLCNACGVRFKSGRLFPEYRPAASPTFVPSLHSNSHRKIIEMRIKGCQKDITAATTPLTTVEPELIHTAVKHFSQFEEAGIADYRFN